MLEDRVALLRRMADQAESRGQSRAARSFRSRAESADGQAERIRDVLETAATATLRRVAAEDLPAEESAA
jgi:hypothetical protein